MKKSATIFLLILLVLVQTPVNQLFRLPDLLEHYSKHQERNGISFRAFLQEHYSHNHTDADWPEDQQLPFKQINYYSIGQAIIPRFTANLISVPEQPQNKIQLPAEFIPVQDPSAIFHPPRLAHFL